MDKLKSSKKKYCVALVTDDSFLIGTLVTLYSFLKHNTWFDGDVVIICQNLSDTNRDYLKLIYEKLDFLDVHDSLSSNIDKFRRSFPKISQRVETFISLEIFRLRNYSKVLYIDSDLLYRKSIEELFELPHNLVACGDGAFYNKGRQWKITVNKETDEEKFKTFRNSFNSGMFLVDNSLLTDKNYDKLIEFIENKKLTKDFVTFTDQYALNNYFDGQQYIVSGTYNYLLAFHSLIYKREKIHLKDAHAIHFNIRQKPWELNKVLEYGIDQPTYLKACNLWFEEYVECLQKLHMQKNMRKFFQVN